MMKLALKLNRWFESRKPLYIKMWSRDCDMYETTRFIEFKNRREYNSFLEEVGEWIEGPCTFDFISKEDYLDGIENPVKDRDRVLEAFENGNNFYV